MMATNTLFGEHVRNRPKWGDPAVLEQAVALMGERLQRDFHDLEWNEFAAQELAEAMRHESDGYAIARLLDDKGWAITAQMVETLDSDAQYDAHDAAVRTWVAAEGITPRLAIGVRVRVKGQDGEIVGIDDKRAIYTVFIAAHGHVKTGNGTYGTRLPYEAVELGQEIDLVEEARREL